MSVVLCNIPYCVDFYDDELPNPRPNPKPEDCSLSVLDESLFTTFAAKGIYKKMSHVTIYRRTVAWFQGL